MISGLFSCSEKAIETDLYGPRSDIRNGRHSGRQFRKIQAESKVKSRGRANSESIPSPPTKMLAVFCTYGLGLIPQAVQRISYGYVYMDIAIVLF